MLNTVVVKTSFILYYSRLKQRVIREWSNDAKRLFIILVVVVVVVLLLILCMRVLVHPVSQTYKILIKKKKEKTVITRG